MPKPPKNRSASTAEVPASSDGAKSTDGGEQSDAVKGDDLDAITRRAVAAAIAQLSKDLQLKVDKCVSETNRKYDEVVAENDGLRNQVAALDDRVASLEQKVANQQTTMEQQQATIEKFKSEIQDALRWANRNEQYSRRNGIKITGFKLKDMTAKAAVCALLKDKLGMAVGEDELVAAHIVPRRKPADKPEGDESASGDAGAQGDTDAEAGAQSDTAAEERPLPVLVKFAKRELRDEALQRRKQLKDTGIGLHDDLTRLNIQLINRLKNHVKIKDAWSWNGKIWGQLPNGKKVSFEPYEDIDLKVSKMRKKQQ